MTWRTSSTVGTALPVSLPPLTLACTAEAECATAAPPLVEWLIDREGYLRARWIGVPQTGAARTRGLSGEGRPPFSHPLPLG